MSSMQGGPMSPKMIGNRPKLASPVHLKGDDEWKAS